MLFSRVLFPTDFSSYADAVLACLPDLKTAGLQEVVLLHVIRAGDVPMPETVNQESLDLARWSAEQRLTVARMALEGRGIKASSAVEYGSPVEQIVRVAKEQNVGAIVIGAQGRTVAQELLLGSTAFEVVRRAPVPVLIEKFEVLRGSAGVTCKQLCQNMFERVLHPTDFSQYASAAFAVVKDLASAGAREAILLHVQDRRAMEHRSPEQLAAFDEEDMARLDNLAKELEALGVNTKSIVRHGVPFQETLKVADEENVGIIVLGSLGRSAVQELLGGSTFENVIRLSKRPVLVVRQPS